MSVSYEPKSSAAAEPGAPPLWIALRILSSVANCARRALVGAMYLSLW